MMASVDVGDILPEGVKTETSLILMNLQNWLIFVHKSCYLILDLIDFKLRTINEA